MTPNKEILNSINRDEQILQVINTNIVNLLKELRKN